MYSPICTYKHACNNRKNKKIPADFGTHLCRRRRWRGEWHLVFRYKLKINTTCFYFYICNNTYICTYMQAYLELWNMYICICKHLNNLIIFAFIHVVCKIFFSLELFLSTIIFVVIYFLHFTILLPILSLNAYTYIHMPHTCKLRVNWSKFIVCFIFWIKITNFCRKVAVINRITILKALKKFFFSIFLFF